MKKRVRHSNCSGTNGSLKTNVPACSAASGSSFHSTIFTAVSVSKY